jgi:hypothetical protein
MVLDELLDMMMRRKRMGRKESEATDCSEKMKGAMLGKDNTVDAI